MKNLPILIGSLLVTLIAVVGVAVVFTKKVNAPVPAIDRAIVIGQTKNRMGKEGAEIVLTEFSDLQCPACRAAQPKIKSIVGKYEDRIGFVFRHFPLRELHPNAVNAARAAEAAAKQGAFFVYHDKLYEIQDNWAEEKDPKGKFLELAKSLKLDEAKFQKDYADGTTETQILADEQDGNRIGIVGTPSFFVNGERVELGEVEQKIESMLGGK